MVHCTITNADDNTYHVPSGLWYFNLCFRKRKLYFNILICSIPTHIHFKV